MPADVPVSPLVAVPLWALVAVVELVLEEVVPELLDGAAGAPGTGAVGTVNAGAPAVLGVPELPPPQPATPTNRATVASRLMMGLGR